MIKQEINIKLGDIETAYTLEEKNNGIAVSAPYLDKSEEESDGQDIVKLNTVEIENGPKADFVRKFFNENSGIVTVGLKAYNLDDILFDEVGVPNDAEIVEED